MTTFFSDRQPSVLFVCVKNAGKSQMAAGLMRRAAGAAIAVSSAGTRPGDGVNTQSAAALLEVGVDISAEQPQLITREMIAAADLVVTLGREVELAPDQVAGTPVENWDTDEPSLRGIEGMDRMRLIRDDIASRVGDLVRRLPG